MFCALRTMHLRGQLAGDRVGDRRPLREEGDRRGPDVAQSAGASRAILLSPVQRLPYAEQAVEVPEESIPELRASPQNPHKSGSAGRLPTKNPRTRRHSPAHGGTAATMALPPLIGLYAGSAGLARLTSPVVRTATGLLVSGRSAVRIRSPAPL